MSNALGQGHARFVKMKYRIITRDGPREVTGYAFETPGWPQWHACVRFGNRFLDEFSCDWIVDHYETGLGLSGVGCFKMRTPAPEAMAQFLEKVGREKVMLKLSELGCLP